MLSLYIKALCSWQSNYQEWLTSIIPSTNIISVAHVLTVFSICLLNSIILYRFTKWAILKGLGLFLKKHNVKNIQTLRKKNFFSYLAYYVPLIIFWTNFNNIFIKYQDINTIVVNIYQIIAVLLLTLTINSLINTFVELNQHKRANRSKPIKGLAQFLQITLVFAAFIICIAILTDKTPFTLIAGLGAASALIMLIFKDMITGLVAGVQLSFNHMLKIGDWVSLPKYEVDGEIIDITLTSVKVENWDKSVSTVPTYNLLVNDSVKNWNPMKKFGARRIVRSFSIDATSVKICSVQDIDAFLKIKSVKEAIESIKMVNDVRSQAIFDKTIDAKVSNLGIFRAYIFYYLQHKEGIRADLDIVVKHKPLTPTGVPIDIVCYSNSIDSKPYELLQADIFEHLFAMAPAFDLQVFQAKCVV
ncbi:MAG: mechanosensitive ion channel family protein [Bacteroidales bacterium]